MGSIPFMGHFYDSRELPAVFERLAKNMEVYRAKVNKASSDELLLRMGRAMGFTEQAIDQMESQIKEGAVAHAPPF